MESVTFKQALLITTLLIPVLGLIAPVAAPWAAIALGLLWMFMPGTNWRLDGINKHKELKAILLLFAYYFLGFLWSDYADNGRHHLEIKLSFLFFPFIVSSRPDLNKQAIRFIGLIFSGVCVTYGLLLIYRSLFASVSGRGILCSFEFTPWFHASYLAMYFLFSILWIIKLAGEWPWGKQLIALAAISVLVFSIILSSSKVNILLMPLLVIFTLKRYHSKHFTLKRCLWVGAAFLTLIIAIIYSLPPTKKRFSQMISTVAQRDNLDLCEKESTAARILIWDAALDLLLRYPMGCGTCNANNYLFELYRKKGYQGIADEKYNAHNQFLQTGIALGITGMFMLVAVFYIPLRNKRSLFFQSFLILSLGNACVESIFETQAGIMFFSFFYCLLLQHD